MASSSLSTPSAERTGLGDWLREARARLEYVLQAWGLIRDAAGVSTAAWLALLVLQGLLPAATVQLTRLLIDGLAEGLYEGGSLQGLTGPLVLSAALAGTLLLGELLRGASNWVSAAQAEMLQDHISDLILAKSTAVDIAYYESPDYYDQLYRARSDAASRSVQILNNLGSALQNAITLAAMAALLLPYGIWLPPVLLLGTLPAFYGVVRSNARYHRWWSETTADRRWVQYYDTILTSSSAAPEVRLFGLGPRFRALHRELRERLRAERLGLIKQQGLVRLAAGALGLVVAGLTMVWMIWRALQGQASLGDLALFYQAFSRGQALLRSLLEGVGQIYSNSVYLNSLFQFLAIEPTVKDPTEPVPLPAVLRRGVRFRHVSFAYPQSPRLALDDLDLEVRPGSVVAVVGENGAGKTTLLKLLCRFYDPTEGSIEIDGVDVRDLSLDELRRRVTVLFQWPVAYQATARDNIAMGDPDAAEDQARVEAAASAAGAHDLVGRLPKGYDTLLGRWFAEGSELSAGEWQRIALARAYVRRSETLVLDEPTSFMDSWSEADWFDRLRGLADGRAVLLITHRFTIAMRADVIHVMQEGQVVESGSHEELLAMDGLYARSWASQMGAQAALT